jgi:Mrp family chromosome partitioning ATPase
MRSGRGKLPVLAEISGPAPGKAQPWGLRGEDFDRLAEVGARLGERQAVLVTGGAEEAGAVAIAVAGISSAAGRRTVLLDCDLAQPRLAATLRLSEAPGMHEYLRWEASAPQLLQPLALAGAASAASSDPLIFIAAGRPAADPRVLLGLESFHHMAAKLRNAYDLVVMSGPAVGGDAGLEVLAGEADSVLAAIGPAQRKGRRGRAVRAALLRLGPAALGAVVLSASDAQRS